MGDHRADRFDIVYEQKQGIGERIRVMRDRETGVCYLHALIGAGSSITPMLDADGKPVVQPVV